MSGIYLWTPLTSKWTETHENELYQVACIEMQGHRAGMEDAHQAVLMGNKAYFAVFDGHCGSEVAEAVAPKIYELLSKLEYPYKDSDLLKACETASNEINKLKTDAGSTAVIVLVNYDEKSKQYMIDTLNIGDSRALLIQSTKFIDLTEDHKPDKEEARIKAAGGYVWANRLQGNLSVSRSFGDKYLQPFGLISVPDIKRSVAVKGDTLLLFCDGIVERMDNTAVCKFARLEKTALDTCKRLVHESFQAGSLDNMSVICVKLGDFSCRKSDIEFIPRVIEPTTFNGIGFEEANDKFMKRHELEATKYQLREAEHKLAVMSREFEAIKEDLEEAEEDLKEATEGYNKIADGIEKRLEAKAETKLRKRRLDRTMEKREFKRSKLE